MRGFNPEHREEKGSFHERLLQAREHALELSEAERRDQEENLVFSAFLRGEISLTEFHEQDPRGDQLYPGEVEMRNPDELLQGLSLFVSQEVAEDLVEHEADHYDLAMAHGFRDTKILIRFFNEDGKISLRPAIALVLPKYGNDDEIRKRVQEIIEAPDDLSDIDKEQLR
jgi:hypothetical protein